MTKESEISGPKGKIADPEEDNEKKAAAPLAGVVEMEIEMEMEVEVGKETKLAKEGKRKKVKGKE